MKAWSANSSEDNSPFGDRQHPLRVAMYYVDKKNKRLIKHNPGNSLGQNKFEIVKEKSKQYLQLENFIKSKEPVRQKIKTQSIATFWHRVTKEMRKEPDFIENFEAYKAKYCLPKLLEALAPSAGKTDLATTKRLPNEGEYGKSKAKKQKKGAPGQGKSILKN